MRLLTDQSLCFVEGDQGRSFPEIGLVGEDLELLVGEGTNLEGPGADVDPNNYLLLHEQL